MGQVGISPSDIPKYLSILHDCNLGNGHTRGYKVLEKIRLEKFLSFFLIRS